jgi:glycosyltransferase involved in cell wall biosynthesis
VLAHWLSAEEYEHLHCHFGNSGSSTGLLAAKLAGVPFSLTCHGSELLHVSHYRLDYKAQQAAFVACVSYYGRALLMMACPPEFWPKLQVVRCGLPKAPPAKAPRPPKAKESILCVGRLSEEKGHLVLLDALARLRERGFQAECVLVGDGPMRGEVEARIARLRLADMVRLTGSLPSDRVAGLYHTASVVVLASFSEGVPVVLMEAMSAGCPVVATQVGGVGELVQDRLTGRLVAPGNAESLAEALEWVLTHPDETRVMVREARGLIEREFCQETAAGQLAGLFKCSRMLTGQDAPPAATKPAPCLVAQAAKPAGPSSLVL